MECQPSVRLLWNTFNVARACSCNSFRFISTLVFPVRTLSILTDLFVRCPLFVVCSEMDFFFFFFEEMTVNCCFFFYFLFWFDIESVCS